MSSWAKPGVKCVCVDDSWDAYLSNRSGVRSPARVPKRNEVVTVELIKEWRGRTYISLVEMGDGCGYDVNNFRPLISQADDIAMFQKLVDTMKPTERLDVLRELLDTTSGG